MSKKSILVITDGIGYNPSSEFNAFNAAKKPTYEWLEANAAKNLLKTSGLAVGLPNGQMGNSEVGHMTIGSGRILYQNLVKIDKAIESDKLKDNPELTNDEIREILNSNNKFSNLRKLDKLIPNFFEELKEHGISYIENLYNAKKNGVKSLNISRC